MAWLEQQPNGIFHVAFRYDGQKFKKTLRTRCNQTAAARLHRVDENIRLVESGRLTIPENGDVAAFLLSDGELGGAAAAAESPKRKLRTIRELSEAFMNAIPSGALEESTLTGMRTHLKHLLRVFGVSFRFVSMELQDLQRYVDSRSRQDGIRGGSLSPATIKKEITTLRTMWNWANDAGYVSQKLPLKGLRYPKGKDKPPFQTREQIEQHQLSEDEQCELWASLFLTTTEIDELLTQVNSNALQAFIYPMFVFAAHTGARRSEMLRSELDDVDFASGEVTIREKKRVRGRLTTRSVPLSPLLERVLRRWFADHPGGKYTFTLGLDVDRSKKSRDEIEGISRDEAHDHFKRGVAGTSWSQARGWHVFRHSFCSNCAAAGIDQRLINGWVGHQTPEMVKRYRHLIPSQQRQAIADVFGDT